MFFDADNDPYEAMNDRDLMDNTPIGTLRVIDYGECVCVAVMDKHDENRVGTIIYTLSVGENPLNAIYGRRTFEGPRIEEIFGIRKRAADAAVERERAAISTDFRNELRRFAFKREDGTEAIAGALGMPVSYEGD